MLLVDQTQEALDHALAQLSPEEQGRCQTFIADVSSEAYNYADRALQLWDRLDIAVLNAGICKEPASILETDIQVWDKTMEVNGRGGYSVTLLPLLIRLLNLVYSLPRA